jgi:hypothetical protein
MRTTWDVAQWTCGVLGALVLYAAVVAGLWAGTVQVLRRRPARGRGDGPPSLAERRARSWDDLPTWLSRDRPWAVAMVLLGAPGIRERTERHVDFRRRQVDWPGLLAEADRWPAKEGLLVAIAYDLAGRPADPRPATDVPAARSPEPVTLEDVITLLDERDVGRVGVAVEVRRGRVEPREALARLART